MKGCSVRIPPPVCDLSGRRFFQLSFHDAILRASTVLRIVRRSTLEAQKHAEWWQAAKTRNRQMGQTEYGAAIRTSRNRSADQGTLIVMDRDRRLTGYLRGQSDNVNAPAGFELNAPWRVSGHKHLVGSGRANVISDRERHFIVV